MSEELREWHWEEILDAGRDNLIIPRRLTWEFGERAREYLNATEEFLDRDYFAPAYQKADSAPKHEKMVLGGAHSYISSLTSAHTSSTASLHASRAPVADDGSARQPPVPTMRAGKAARRRVQPRGAGGRRRSSRRVRTVGGEAQRHLRVRRVRYRSSVRTLASAQKSTTARRAALASGVSSVALATTSDASRLRGGGSGAVAARSASRKRARSDGHRAAT